MRKNAFSAEALTRTPLKKLTALPRSSNYIWGRGDQKKIIAYSSVWWGNTVMYSLYMPITFTRRQQWRF